jgi:hypothetical protein
MASFKVGDNIGWIKKTKIWYGKIVSIGWNSVCQEEEYRIQWDASNNNQLESYVNRDVDSDWFRINDVDFSIMTGTPIPDPDMLDAMRYAGGPIPWKHGAGVILPDGKNVFHEYPPSGVKLIPKDKPACNHNFVQYNGFNDFFEYCTICDEKKR